MKITYIVFRLYVDVTTASVADVASVLGIKYSTAYYAIRELEKKGYVERTGPGIYELRRRVWKG